METFFQCFILFVAGVISIKWQDWLERIAYSKVRTNRASRQWIYMPWQINRARSREWEKQGARSWTEYRKKIDVAKYHLFIAPEARHVPSDVAVLSCLLRIAYHQQILINKSVFFIDPILWMPHYTSRSVGRYTRTTPTKYNFQTRREQSTAVSRWHSHTWIERKSFARTFPGKQALSYHLRTNTHKMTSTPILNTLKKIVHSCRWIDGWKFTRKIGGQKSSKKL